MTIRIFITIFLFAPLYGVGQIFKSLEKRYLEPFKWTEFEVQMSDEQKIQWLSHLHEDDTIEFLDYNGELFPLDTAGLHYLDLDMDNDLDLIYQTYYGGMGRGSSKIYVQEDGYFDLKGRIQGWIYDINLKPKFEIISYDKPCCDSYTNSIRTYTLNQTISCTSNIVFIGLAYYGLRGYPSFETNDLRLTGSASFYISPIDLRNGGYFRERTKEIRSELRSGNFVMCGEIPDGSEVGILDSIEVEEKKWYLVITDPISKPDSSLFEDYQTRFIEKSRYMGWVNEQGISKQKY
jgi:hypothetical protein